MSECVFCKIVSGQLPSETVYEDERCMAFVDIQPQAPVHILVIPRQHIESLAQVESLDAPLLGHLLWVCSHVADRLGIAQAGYRVTTNIGAHGAQSVRHLHLHVLGGRQLTGAMG